MDTLRSFRIADISVIDTVGTLVIAILLEYFIFHYLNKTKHKYIIHLFLVTIIFVILVLLSIPIHKYFGVKTKLSNFILF